MTKAIAAIVPLSGNLEDAEELVEWAESIARDDDVFYREEIEALKQAIVSRGTGPLVRAGYMTIAYSKEAESWVLEINARGMEARQKWRNEKDDWK